MSDRCSKPWAAQRSKGPHTARSGRCSFAGNLCAQNTQPLASLGVYFSLRRIIWFCESSSFSIQVPRLCNFSAAPPFINQRGPKLPTAVQTLVSSSAPGDLLSCGWCWALRSDWIDAFCWVFYTTNQDRSVKRPQADDRSVRAAGAAAKLWRTRGNVWAQPPPRAFPPFSTSPPNPLATPRSQWPLQRAHPCSVPKDLVLLEHGQCSIPLHHIPARSPGFSPHSSPRHLSASEGCSGIFPVWPCIPQKAWRGKLPFAVGLTRVGEAWECHFPILWAPPSPLTSPFPTKIKETLKKPHFPKEEGFIFFVSRGSPWGKWKVTGSFSVPVLRHSAGLQCPKKI